MRNINIKAVAQMTGINENTLRAWERRYQLVEPTRSDDGYRQYSQSDVEKLTLLGGLVKRGHQIGNLASLTIVQLKKMSEQHSAQQGEAAALSREVPTPLERVHLQSIIASLKKFDINGIRQSLQTARFELSPKLIVTNLIIPLLQNVGGLVLSSELSVAQEHLLSSFLRDYLGDLFQSLSPYDYKSHSLSLRILLTTREGDLHEFGILLAAILCRIHGHETYYLGANMPVEDLAQACKQFKIKVLILGMVALPEEKELISPKTYLEEFDRLAPKQVMVLTGGASPDHGKKLHSKRKFINFSSIQELDTYLGKTK